MKTNRRLWFVLILVASILAVVIDADGPGPVSPTTIDKRWEPETEAEVRWRLGIPQVGVNE